MNTTDDVRAARPEQPGEIESWMADNRERVASDIGTLVRHRSTAPNDSPDHTDVVSLLKNAGLSVRAELPHPDLESHYEYTTPFLSPESSPRANLTGWSDGIQGPTVLFSVHFDVVPPGAHPEPWSGRYDGSRVYGRGTADTKNNLVMLVAALRCVRDTGLSLRANVIVDIVTDEEAGGTGALSTLIHGRDPDEVVVLEPTGLRVHHGHRGCVGFEIDVVTSTGHMGSSVGGESAIGAATATIERLRNLETEWLLEARHDPDFGSIPRPLQLNISGINATSWHGSTPSTCTLVASLGFLPSRTRAMVMAAITAAIGPDTPSTRYSIRWCGIRNQGYVGSANGPTAARLRSAVVASGADAGDSRAWHVSCDARLYSRLTNAETIIFGSGELADAHSDDESVSVDQVLVGAAALARFLTDSAPSETPVLHEALTHG